MEKITDNLYLINNILLLLGGVYLIVIGIQWYAKRRKFEFSKKNIVDYFLSLLVLLPALVCVYFFPTAFYDENFWSSESANMIHIQEGVMQFLFLIFILFTLFSITSFFPHNNKYYNLVPSVFLFSLFPGIANSLIIMIITHFLNYDTDIEYLLLFFAVSTLIFITTTRTSKRKSIFLGNQIAIDLNKSILEKIFNFSFAKFEKIKGSKIFTILNGDVNEIISFSGNFISIFTSIITTVIVIGYLFTINVVSSTLLLGVVVVILAFHLLLSKKFHMALHYSREQREEYINYIVGLIDGFKELVLHGVKRVEYNKDLQKGSIGAYNASLKASYINVNKLLFSDLCFISAIGISCLLFPVIFNFEKEVVTSYIIAILFLWSPFNKIISTLPSIIGVQVAWKRIKDFLDNQSPDNQLSLSEGRKNFKIKKVNEIKMQDICFSYSNSDEEQSNSYGIGPINFVAKARETIFLIGGNGSGKTTFLKILIGLYKPDKGTILINGKKVSAHELGEYFSVIFSDFYLFKKIYGINPDRLQQVNEWLDVLGLSEKVEIKDGAFSTIKLSKGQRKRLVLLKSYLEDRPIYFFDECAADLDPDFKHFFYTKLLRKMSEEGKILIVITHDEQYFHLSDRLYKMDLGKMSEMESTAPFYVANN